MRTWTFQSVLFPVKECWGWSLPHWWRDVSRRLGWWGTVSRLWRWVHCLWRRRTARGEPRKAQTARWARGFGWVGKITPHGGERANDFDSSRSCKWKHCWPQFSAWLAAQSRIPHFSHGRAQCFPNFSGVSSEDDLDVCGHLQFGSGLSRHQRCILGRASGRRIVCSDSWMGETASQCQSQTHIGYRIVVYQVNAMQLWDDTNCSGTCVRKLVWLHSQELQRSLDIKTSASAFCKHPRWLNFVCVQTWWCTIVSGWSRIDNESGWAPSAGQWNSGDVFEEEACNERWWWGYPHTATCNKGRPPPAAWEAYSSWSRKVGRRASSYVSGRSWVGIVNGDELTWHPVCGENSVFIHVQTKHQSLGGTESSGKVSGCFSRQRTKANLLLC